MLRTATPYTTLNHVTSVLHRKQHAILTSTVHDEERSTTGGVTTVHFVLGRARLVQIYLEKEIERCIVIKETPLGVYDTLVSRY